MELPELAVDAPVFGPAASAFLTDLAADNSRAFFTDGRARYDAAVRGPMEALLARAEPRWGAGRVMRPNRDVRFSADKSPYRTTASMWAGTGASGAYLQIAAEGLEVGGGLYEPSRDQLARGRAVIARGGANTAALRRIVDDLEGAGFVVAGPSLKTAPRDYPRDHPHVDLLRLRHYAALTGLPRGATLGDIEAAWERVAPLSEWAERHVGAAQSWP